MLARLMLSDGEFGYCSLPEIGVYITAWRSAKFTEGKSKC